MRRLDAFLMTRVFQPTVDAMAGRASAADAARFFLTGAMVLVLARMMADAAVALPTWPVLLDFLALWAGAALMRAVGQIADARANPLRDRFALARRVMAALTLLVWFMGATSLQQSLGAMQLTLWVSALYFASCDPPTTSRRRAPRRGRAAVARALPLG